MSKNIILLGGSNSVMVNGLQKGLREGIEKFNLALEEQSQTPKEQNQVNKNLSNKEIINGGGGGKLTFYNLALGACTSIQNFYEIKRERNQELLENAELIITESNINEINHSNSRRNLSTHLIYYNLCFFYKELYFLKKKVLLCIFPRSRGAYKIINNIHRKLCLKYGFNIIDMQSYYEKVDLVEFGEKADPSHPLPSIMKLLGRSIITSLGDFHLPKNLNIINDNPKFKVCTPKDMKLLSGTLKEIRMHNSMYDETAFRLTKETKIQFPKAFEGDFVIGVHTWNKGNEKNEYSSFILKNQTTSIVKENGCLNTFLEVQNNFQIDEKSCVRYDEQNSACFKEYHNFIGSWKKGIIKLKYCDIIAFFLASNNELTDKEDLKLLENLNTLADLTLELPKDYDFSYLIPPVEVYKEIIEEYCARMDPRKLNSLQNKIKTLEQELKFGTATQRIHNHLAYKLGSAIIENSKSLFGYIRMFYVLSYIRDKHLREQNLALPPLESYLDYQEALKEKECFTYKLGEAFIKAYKSWYKGGFIKFFFEAKSLYKEFKSKKAKQE